MTDGRELVVGQMHVTIGLQIGFGHLQRRMRTVEGEIDEEGPRAVSLDEVDGGVGEDVAAIARLLDGPAVVLQDRVEVTAPARWVGGLSNSSPLEHQGLLETLIDGPQRVVIAEVPLAEDGRAVAGRPEHLGQGHLLRVHHRPAHEGIDHACAVVIAAGHQACPRRSAHRHDVKLVEPHALAGELIEMRSADLGIAVKAEVPMALIVGDDHDNVWPPGFRWGRGRSQTPAPGEPAEQGGEADAEDDARNDSSVHTHPRFPRVRYHGMRQPPLDSPCPAVEFGAGEGRPQDGRNWLEMTCRVVGVTYCSR